MPGAGCEPDRCCFDEAGDIPACYHWHEIIGYVYDDGMDPIHHDACYVGIEEDPGESSHAGCRKCFHGCDGFEDDLANLFLTALWVDGKSYLRSEIDGRFGRDAKNRIFDLVTNKPMLIQRRCRLEHGSCYENKSITYGGWVCWGHHVCQCTPEPDWSDPCPTAPAGYPVSGLTPDIFFFNYQGWPPYGGTLPSVDLFCRKWHPANGGSPRNAPINVHRHGSGPVCNAVFLRSREGLNIDVLVPCAGFIAGTDCAHDNHPYDDCTYADQKRKNLVDLPINQTQPSSQGKFEELWIDLDTVDIRMRDYPSLSKQQLREHQLYADIFAEAIGRSYPHPEGGYLNMDRVAMHLPADNYVGRYERTWNGADWEEGDLPIIMRFPYCYTKWGRVYVAAQMVITYCKMIVNLTVPHFARAPTPGTGLPSKHWIMPYATVEIDVHTAMQCYMVPTPIKVGGVPVTLTMPMWIQGQGYDGIPTVTPNGNQIVYAREADAQDRPLPVRCFRKWRWWGRLGSFSDPPTAVNPEHPDFDYADMNCEDLIDMIGTFRVPALATANETHPEDPNRNWAGGISFFFSHQA
jgi:hypothetical protein